jgi:hypothetical protein
MNFSMVQMLKRCKIRADFTEKVLKQDSTIIGRGLLAKIISLRGTHVGNTWFGVYLKGI